jgi:type I restriction enzyme S subunit
MPNLNTNILSRVPINLPSLTTQHKIVTILDSISGTIETLQHQNTALESIAQTLFRSWFVNFDPVHAKAAGNAPEAMSAELAELFPSEFEESKLSLIPKGWDVIPFSESIVIHSGGTPKTSISEYWNGDIPWFSVTDAPESGQVFVLQTDKYITRIGLESSPTKMLPLRSTIISARGTVGKIGMVSSSMTMNQSCYALSPKSIQGNYWVYFQTKELINQLKQMSHGGVFDTITRDTLKGVKVIQPSESIFKALSNICQPLFDSIECNCKLSQRLTVLRDHLLPRLISGKLSLDEAEKAVEEALAV